MKKLFALLSFLLFISFSITAQESCDCEKEFNWVVNVFQENDAAFPDIIEKKGEKEYSGFTDGLKRESRETKTKDECVILINKWLRYLRKGHHGYINKADADMSDIYKINDSIREEFKIIKLSDQTLYLKFPSMLYPYKTVMDSLLSVNDQLLRTTPNLIIDIRNSRGGSDFVWSGLQPYLYTSPVRRPLLETRCTTFTAEKLKEYIDSSPYIDLTSKNMLEDRIKLISKNAGKFSDFNGDKEQTFISSEINISLFPRRAGIIYSENNGSANEGFLMWARQSYKVKTYGVNTYGVFDVSNLMPAKSPYTRNTLFYTTTRSKWLPKFSIDDVGFTPDIYLGDIPQERWIDEVIRHIESN